MVEHDPEDRDFLLEFENLLQHYTVTAHAGGAIKAS